MSKIEYKVRLQGNDAKDYVITFERLWDKIKTTMTYDETYGWNNATRCLREDYNKLEEIILSEILIPKAREEILAFLKENPNVKTREFYNEKWLIGLRSIAWYHAREELEKEGFIISEVHGRGQNRTWKLNEKSW